MKLTYPPAPFGTQANIKSVKVNLPKQLPSRLTTLQKACPDSTFDQSPGRARGIAGRGSDRDHPGAAGLVVRSGIFRIPRWSEVPELVVVLSGYGVTVELHGETFINKAGITSSTFRQVPDVPIRELRVEAAPRPIFGPRGEREPLHRHPANAHGVRRTERNDDPPVHACHGDRVPQAQASQEDEQAQEEEMRCPLEAGRRPSRRRPTD